VNCQHRHKYDDSCNGVIQIFVLRVAADLFDAKTATAKNFSLLRNELSAIKSATLSTLLGLTQCPVTSATAHVIKFCELAEVHTSVVPVVSLVKV